METLTFDNFQERVTASVLTKAKKMVARDMEEIAPNKFVAYVDDATESYDVAIELDKKEIKDISCDCPNRLTFCAHKVALINFLKNKKPSVSKKGAAKKKLTEAELLLAELDESELRLWTSDLFRKNKDIEFLFVNEFSKSQANFTNEDARIIIDKAIKSVIKNKKKIDATELKKIIDALEVALAPVLKFCKDNIALPESNELLLFTNSLLFEFHDTMYLNSIKMLRYIEKNYKEINFYIHSLQNQKQWETIVDENIKFLLLEKNMFGMQMETVFHLYDSIDSKERKVFFANVMFDIFTITVNKGTRYIKEIQHFFIKVFSENELFSKVYSHFSALRYENEYNVFLIEKLIEIEKYDLAEQFSKEQIERNSNDKYNVDYFKLLFKIFSITQDESKMASLQMKLIFYDFSIENYQLIQKHLVEEEFKKFRVKILTHFKRNFHGNSKSIKAYFEILFWEKKYKMMLENISEYSSYEMIYLYKEELFLLDKLNFLLALTKIERSSWYVKKDKSSIEFREKFIVWIKEHYDTSMIKTVMQSKSKYETTPFITAFDL